MSPTMGGFCCFKQGEYILIVCQVTVCLPGFVERAVVQECIGRLTHFFIDGLNKNE